MLPPVYYMLGAKLFLQPQLIPHTMGTIHRVIILPFDATQSELYQDDVIKCTINITHTIRSHTQSHLLQLYNILQYLTSWKLHNLKYY